ncbi:MAG: type II secretion system protein [Phycisphaeraceae bacterium]
MRQNHRGLSLIEITIVLTLISVMMALSLPMLSVANAKARSELCQQNLVEIGQTIASHAQDNNQLPTLYNLAPPQAGLSLPEFVEPRLNIPKITFCPSDETEASQLMGTSYRWGMAFNGVDTGNLQSLIGQRMLADREAFHNNAAQPTNEMVIVEDEAGLRLSLIGDNAPTNASNNQPNLYLKKKLKKDKKNKTKKKNKPNRQNDDD